MAFAFGAVLLLLLLADSLISRLKSSTALMSYPLPSAPLALIAGTGIAIDPEPGFRSTSSATWHWCWPSTCSASCGC